MAPFSLSPLPAISCQATSSTPLPQVPPLHAAASVFSSSLPAEPCSLNCRANTSTWTPQNLPGPACPPPCSCLDESFQPPTYGQARTWGSFLKTSLLHHHIQLVPKSGDCVSKSPIVSVFFPPPGLASSQGLCVASSPTSPLPWALHGQPHTSARGWLLREELVIRVHACVWLCLCECVLSVDVCDGVCHSVCTVERAGLLYDG